LEWPDVVRVLQDPKTREAVLSRYRTAEYTPDDFGRLRGAREALADALTRCEDWLELARPKNPERTTIRETRRRLERELSA
jgi:hypothetical protein